MKTILASILLATALMAGAVEIPTGSISKNESFSLRKGEKFKKSKLQKSDGKIVILMMMTPWCPICQSHSKAVGDGLLDYYNSNSRGKMRGKNAKGVKIESILLSTEEAPQWDSVNSQFASQNGFKKWGLDAMPDRSEPRTLLGYFRGGFINSSNLYDWGDDRRRLVVINMVRNSPKHAYREIIVNQNSFTSADAAKVRKAIDAIKPARRAKPSAITPELP
jgi:thiol-disulfide isomerase/thioredoxin